MEEEGDRMENTLLLADQPIRTGMRECGRGLSRGSAGQENFTVPLSPWLEPQSCQLPKEGNIVNICK